MARDDDLATVSFDGGPEITLTEFKKIPEALRKMRKAKERGIGDNSEPLAADRLRSLVERIERLMKERKSIANDITDIFAEAQGAGFDKKALRAIIKERSEDAATRREREELMDVYRSALGMLSDTELGAAAMAKV